MTCRLAGWSSASRIRRARAPASTSETGGSRASAVAVTARQTKAVYGLDWGGGVFANYAFVAVWAFDAWRWRAGLDRHGSDPLTWPIRIFFLVMIANGAIVFVTGPRWMIGAAIVVTLLWVWRPARWP